MPYNTPTATHTRQNHRTATPLQNTPQHTLPHTNRNTHCINKFHCNTDVWHTAHKHRKKRIATATPHPLQQTPRAAHSATHTATKHLTANHTGLKKPNIPTHQQVIPMSTHTWSWFLGAPHQTLLVHNQKLAAIARPWPTVHPCIRIILFALRHWSPQPVVWNGKVWRVHSDGRWPENSPNFKNVIHGRTCHIEPFASKHAAQHTKFNSFHFRIVKHVFPLIQVHIQIAACFNTWWWSLCIHICMFHGAHIWNGATAHLHKTSSAVWSYGQYSSMNAYDCIGPIPLCVSTGKIAHSNGMISLPQLKYFQCSGSVRSRSSR